MKLPDDIQQWPAESREQWLADELWLLATNDETPAPPTFVEAMRLVVSICKPDMGTIATVVDKPDRLPHSLS